MRVTSPHSWCAPISGQEAAEQARYVLDLPAGTLTSEDRRRQTPIAAVLAEFERLVARREEPPHICRVNWSWPYQKSPPTCRVQQPTKIELIINMKTAKALGIPFPTAPRSRRRSD